jgi:hypothetical protein
MMSDYNHLMPTKSELQRLLEEFQRHVERQAARLAEQAALIEDQKSTIASLEFRRAELCRLTEAAELVGVPYERARRWAERGLVTSAKKLAGTRWVVNVEDLRLVAALHTGHRSFGAVERLA